MSTSPSTALSIASSIAPATAPATREPLPPAVGLGAEVRESLLLLSFAVAVTVGLTTAAQAALAILS